MTIDQMHDLARQLMDANGLSHVPIVWTRSKLNMGTCVQCRNNMTGETRVLGIKFSRPLMSVVPEDEQIDTIKHEIAHALVGFNHDHDVFWKAKAIQLGCKPQACCAYKFDRHQIKQIGFKHAYECPQCKAAYGVTKVKPGRYVCPHCRVQTFPIGE